MAFYDLVWYCNAGDQSTTGHYAVAKWAASASIAAGALRRQLAAPSVNNERVFICIVAGTTGGSEPTWVLTRGAKTTDNTVTWQEVTGASAVNGDLTNTPNWTQAKAIGTPTLGAIIKRGNNASYWICSTAGTMGASEPAWPNDTAGTTQADGTTTWTCLGVVTNFTGGQAPHARLLNACTSNWFAFGNTVYVGDNHAETQSAPNLGLTVTGSQTLMSKVLCHNHSGSYPPTAGNLTTGATISTTAFATITLSLITGSFYFYGIAFKAGSGASGSTAYFVINNSGAWAYFDNCSFQIIATGSGNTITFGSNSSSNLGNVIFNNTTVYFGNVGDSMNFLLHQFLWQNTGQVLVAGSSVPTNFLYASTGSGGQQDTIVLEALDLSQITGNLFNVATTTLINVTIKDCKLNAAATIPALTVNSGPIVQLIRSDSSGTGYKSSRYTFEGAETTDTTVTRVGGAADPTGQAQSRKIVTTANSQWLRPFKAEPYAIWNPRTAANVVVTVCGNAVGSLPNNDDIWLEVEYLGDAGSAASYDAWNPSDKSANILLTNSNLTVGSSASTDNAVRGAVGKSSGKYYYEVTYATTLLGSDTGCGVATSAVSLVTAGTNASSSAIAYVASGGPIWYNGSASGLTLGTTATAGDFICIAVDLDNKRIWFRRNAGNWNGSGPANPATNTGGLDISSVFAASSAYPIMAINSSTPLLTANFGATAFAQTVPSGFTAGWGTPAATASPLGKIVTTTKSNVLAANAAVPSDASSWNYTIPNTTLNPADKEAHISLSGGNLTALGTAGWTGSVRAVDGQSSGKYYWECTFNASASGSGVGANISALAIATIFSGAGTGQAGVMQNGSVYVDGSTTLTVGGVGSQTISFGTITSGTVICVAIDVPNKLMWWRLGAAGNWNNNASRNPATGVGGTSVPNISTAYPSISFGGADTIIANFGSSTFTGAVPSGFTAGVPAAFTLAPFKLTATLSSPQPGMGGYLHARVRAAKPSTTYYIDPQITLS